MVYQCYTRARFIAVISLSRRCSLRFESVAFQGNRGQGAMRVATGVLVDRHVWKVLVRMAITRPWKRLTSSSTKNTAHLRYLAEITPNHTRKGNTGCIDYHKQSLAPKIPLIREMWQLIARRSGYLTAFAVFFVSI